MNEYEHAAPRGLPGVLPAGERILWQCAPRWRALAWRAFKVRAVLWYFGALMVWRQGSAWSNGDPAAALGSIGRLGVMAGIAIAALSLLAWLTARSAVYTITNRRLLIRSGIALPITVNIPLGQVHSAAVRVGADGTGDLPLELQPGVRVSATVLWPHVRPWSYTRPQPMLRAIDSPQTVAALLAEALQASAPAPASATTHAPAGLAAAHA